MNLVLIGAPGVGKGTEAVKISDYFKIPQISTGDILREAVQTGNELGHQVSSYMQRGELVPDSIVSAVLVRRLDNPDCQSGFVLDGFPRTINQAEELSILLNRKNQRIDLAINLEASPEIIIERLTGRRQCKKCNAIYHVKNCPPSREGKCDICGEALYQRDDDHTDTIRERLRVYNVKTAPLIEYYQDRGMLRSVQTDQGPDETFQEILKLLREHMCS